MARAGQKSRKAAEEVASSCVGARVRSIGRTVTRIYDEHLRPHGIKFSQMNILTLVSLSEPVSPREISAMLDIEKSTLSRNVKLMEANGWIRTRPGEVGNQVVIETTAKGRRLYAATLPSWRAAQAQVRELFGGDAVEAIYRAFGRLRQERDTG